MRWIWLCVLVGCSDDKTTTPDTSTDSAVTETVAAEDTEVVEDVFVPVETKLVIGPAGGTLTSEDGVVTIVVPADAVINDTTFSIITEPDSAYRLLPDVVDFQRPVTVSFTGSFVEEGMSLLVFDGARWLPLGRSTVSGEVVSAPRWRLSRMWVGYDASVIGGLGEGLAVVDHEEPVHVAKGHNDAVATGDVGKEFNTLAAACDRMKNDVPFFEFGAGGTPIRLHRYHRVDQIAVGEGTFAGAVCDVGVMAGGRALTTVEGPLMLVDARGPSGGFTVHSTRDCVTLVDSGLFDSEISDCAIGVTLDGHGSSLGGSTVRDNDTGVAALTGGHVLTGNLLSCNRVHDLDTRETIDARGQHWDHVPPSEQDLKGPADTTDATLASEPCE